MFASGTGASSPKSESNAVPYSRRALASSFVGSDEVRGSDLRHVHLEPRVLADEHSRRAGVVEVDVRQEEVAQVGEVEPARGEAGLEVGKAGRRAAVEKRGPVEGLEQVDADDALVEVVEIDRLGARDSRHKRAWSRSSMRSSADSMPTESRTRLPGTAKGASAVEA